MLNTIILKCQDYYNRIPEGALPAASKSALFSFGISMYLINSVSEEQIEYSRSLRNAQIAAVASLINSAITPLLDRFLLDYDLTREIARHIIASDLTSRAMNYVNLTGSSLPMIN